MFKQRKQCNFVIYKLLPPQTIFLTALSHLLKKSRSPMWTANMLPTICHVGFTHSCPNFSYTYQIIIIKVDFLCKKFSINLHSLASLDACQSTYIHTYICIASVFIRPFVRSASLPVVVSHYLLNFKLILIKLFVNAVVGVCWYCCCCDLQ